MASSQNAIDAILTKASQGDPSTTALNMPEQFFDSIGLMRGPYAPVGRAAFGIVVGCVVMFALRPSWAFTPDGSPNPKARVPWWTVPVALGAVCGVFV